MDPSSTRRRFLQLAGASAAALNFGSSAIAKDNPKVIQGFEKAARDPEASKGWKPISDRSPAAGCWCWAPGPWRAWPPGPPRRPGPG